MRSAVSDELVVVAGVFSTLLVVLNPSFSAAKEFFDKANDKEILDFLLHKSSYDKRLKPVSDGPLRVNVSVLLLSLSSPDESSLVSIKYTLPVPWHKKQPQIIMFPTLNLTVWMVFLALSFFL
ncbi:hypothetical protein FHG87_001777 [Trinorchestia longiramus]|nr:hypothetical protein FHG87_001777 [Trinorchestia longiramus]